jgi:hypothetical protein
MMEPAGQKTEARCRTDNRVEKVYFRIPASSLRRRVAGRRSSLQKKSPQKFLVVSDGKSTKAETRPR